MNTIANVSASIALLTWFGYLLVEDGGAFWDVLFKIVAGVQMILFLIACADLCQAVMATVSR